MSKNAKNEVKEVKPELTPEEQLQFEEMMNSAGERFEGDVIRMKISRDIIWPCIKVNIKNIKEAKAFIEMLFSGIMASVEDYKSKIAFKDLNVSKYLADDEITKDLMEKLANKSVYDIQMSLNNISGLIENIIKKELEENKVEYINSEELFYYDDNELDKKKVEMLSMIEKKFYEQKASKLANK